MKIIKLFAVPAIILTLAAVSFSQNVSPIKRTTYKTDRFDFGVGGTLSITGAPYGSITVEGWSNREIEISAEIEVEGATEADIAILSRVTGFVLQESMGRIGITSVGANDRKAMRKIDKKFPKHLIGKPFWINYVVKVPGYTDLDINGGIGDLTISGVEGVMKINYLDTNAKIDLVGGGITAVIGKGNVDITIPTRSWRGRFADVQVATGTLNLFLPNGLNSNFDASILRTGKIENSFDELKPRTRHDKFTETVIAAKSGTGTIPLKFTVGDGTMKISGFRHASQASIGSN